MIRTSGGVKDLLALAEWFRRDNLLRGQVHLPPPGGVAGQMGDVYSVLTAAIGAAGFAPALIGSLTTWLTQLRSDITVTVERNGTKVDLDAKRVKSAEVLRELRELLEEPDEPR